MTHTLAGKRVYPIYRLDKNVSWYNISNFILGIIYGFITLEWISKRDKYMLWRFKLGKIWLPPIYADNYKSTMK